MNIGNLEFDTEKEEGKPLILKPQVELDLSEFIKSNSKAFSAFCKSNPFFLISGATTKEGNSIGNYPNPVSAHWHIDWGNVIVLSNGFKKNNRGGTEWIADDVLKSAVLAQTENMLKLKSSAFGGSERRLNQFRVIVEKIVENSRNQNPSEFFDPDSIRGSINQLLDILYNDPTKSPEIAEILNNIQKQLDPHVLSCNWHKHDNSTLFFNNFTGFHRGVYNTGTGEMLRRNIVI